MNRFVLPCVVLAAVVIVSGRNDNASGERPRLLDLAQAKIGSLDRLEPALAIVENESLMIVRTVSCTPLQRASGRPRLVIEPACDVTNENLERVD